jgi:hypothetical protein
MPKLHYSEFERIAVAYDEVKKQSSQSRREIFEAINQLVKCIFYEIHGRFEQISKNPEAISKGEAIIMIFPILIFDGDLFEVTFDTGKPKPERKNHILLRTHFRCPCCQRVENFTIDVVHRSYFNEFMRVLREDFRRIREIVSDSEETLTKRAKEARAEKQKMKRSFFR